VRVRAGSVAFSAFLGLAALLAFLFLFVPVAAIFGRIPPGRIWDQLGTKVVQDALRISAEVNLLSLAILLAVGTPASYFLATRRFRGRSLVITLLELPLVMPPAVAGIGLLVAFLPDGPVGRLLHPLGYDVIFRESAVVISVLFVSSPFYLRGAIAAFSDLDDDVLDAARTLGASPRRVFWRIAIPLAMPALGAGAALAFARGVGEFGATIMFAGNLPGVTQSLPLAIYSEFEHDLNVSLAIGALLIVVSAVILLTVKLLVTWASKRATSPYLSATSVSS
jgi:molybdate transport system permease protein